MDCDLSAATLEAGNQIALCTSILWTAGSPMAAKACPNLFSRGIWTMGAKNSSALTELVNYRAEVGEILAPTMVDSADFIRHLFQDLGLMHEP